MKECYETEDFVSIVVGESTYDDVFKIAPKDAMITTSYGGYIDYPTKNNGTIRVKFYGPKMAVGQIDLKR